MATRSIQVVEARPVARTASGLLWGLGGICLLLVTLVGTRQGAASVTLALMVAAFAGALIIVRPEWGVVALTSTFFLSYPEALQGSGRLTINNVVGLMLAALLAMRVGLERRVDFLRSRPVQFSLLIALALLVNNALVDQVPDLPALSPAGSPWRVQELLTKTVYLVFLVGFVRLRWQILVLVWLVVGCVLFTVPSAIWHAVTAVGGATESIREAGRASATFGITIARNANRLSFLCLMATAVIGYALPQVRSRVIRLGGLMAIAILVVTIFLSASRSGLIGLVTLFVLFVTGKRGQRKLTLALLLALAVAVGISLVLVPEESLDRITNIFETERGAAGAGSTRARLELLGIGLQMFVDNPVLGVGVGDFRPVSALHYGNFRRSALHNSYLLALVEGGLLLFSSYMLLFWSLWRDMRETRRVAEDSGSNLAWLAEAIRLIFILFLVFSFFADVWHEVFLYLITGLAVSTGAACKRYTEASAA